MLCCRIFTRGRSGRAFTLPLVNFRHVTQRDPIPEEPPSKHAPGQRPPQCGDPPSMHIQGQRLPRPEEPWARITSPMVNAHRHDKSLNSQRQSLKDGSKRERLERDGQPQRLKDKRDLHQKKPRSHKAIHNHRPREQEVYQPVGELLFGIYPVRLALDAKRRTFYRLLYKVGCEESNARVQELLEEAGERGIPTTPLTPAQLRRVVGGGQVHQGVCADVSPLSPQVFHVEAFLEGTEEKEEKGRGGGNREGVRRGGCQDQGNRCTEGSQSFGGRGSTSTGVSLKPDEEGRVGEGPGGDGAVAAPRLWVYLHEIQDPMNFGAVLRSAYFFGVNRVLVSERNRCSVGGVVSKASAGVAELVPLYTVPHSPTFTLSRLSAAGWIIAATTHHQDPPPAPPTSTSITHQDPSPVPSTAPPATPVDQFPLKSDTLLVIGSEGGGVGSTILGVCDVVLTIPPSAPLHPHATCLNVSTATAVLLHSLSSSLHHQGHSQG